MPKTFETPAKTFVLDTMREWPNNEMTISHLLDWYYTKHGARPPFEHFHVRDALYALEDKGMVVRFKGPEDRPFYWAIAQSGLLSEATA